MRHIRYRIVVVLCMLSFGFGLFPNVSHSQDASPTQQAPLPKQEICTPEEIAAAEFGVTESPLGAALVSPAAHPDEDLYVVKITLQKDACVSYADHYLHEGAIIWLVDSGEIEFDFQPIVGWPAPELAFQTSNGDLEKVTPLMHLQAGDWVSTDRAVNYSYRNIGEEDAVVIMTVLEKHWIVPDEDPDGITMFAAGCNSLCRKRR
jgi:hypothetical protein